MNRLSRFGQLAACTAVAALAACSSKTTPTFDGGASTGTFNNGSTSSGGSSGNGSSSNGGSASAGGSSGGSSNGGSSGGSSGGIGGTQACSDYANAECTLYNSCSNGYQPTSVFGSVTACVTAYETSCAARLAAPQTALTPTQVEACAQGLPGEACGNLYAGENVTPCLAVAGPFAVGAACSVSAQCSTAFCSIAPHEVCGTCQPAPTPGASCVASNCAPGQICLSTTQECEPPVQDGGTCGDEDDCAFGLGCPNADGGLLYCEPAGLAGAPCDYHGRTAVCSLRQGFFCEKVGDGGVCTARAFATTNGTCGDVQGLNTVCEDDGLCVKALPDAGTGTCEAVAADGEACDTASGPNCPDFSRCVLTNPPATAGICTSDYGSCGAGSSGGSTGGGSTGGGTTSGGSTGGSTSGNTIALVDNDGYVNDGNNDDTYLATWQGLMTGAGITAYDTLSVDSNGDMSWNTGGVGIVPSPSQLSQYNAVIWFTADNDNFTMGAGADWAISTDQATNLLNWLDTGNKTLVIFSEYYLSTFYSSSDGAWTQATSGPLFETYLPLQGGEDDPDATPGGNPIEEAPFTVTGTSTVSAAFAALSWDIATNPVTPTAGAMNVATGTDTLATVQASPQDTTIITVAVAAGKKKIGAAKTSTIVYVAFPLENLQASGADTAQAFFNGIVQTYAGVP